jgi:hypothetical protein
MDDTRASVVTEFVRARAVRAPRSGRAAPPGRTRSIAAIAALASLLACEGSRPSGEDRNAAAGPASSAPAPTAPVAAPPPEPRAPEIILDKTNLDIGRDRLGAADPGLAAKALVFLRGAAKIQGSAVDVVALRAARPSSVAALLDALQQAGAASANVKTETRDGATQALPIALVRSVADCTAVAWITKNASVDVWPAGGGVAKRVGRGLGGPDLTLGMEPVHALTESCQSSQVVVGADDAMTWGLVFDLGTQTLHQAWTRTSAAVVVASAVPGRKLVFAPSPASRF